jgi:hypothetical protein
MLFSTVRGASNPGSSRCTISPAKPS